jgi:hypothetical protein
MTDPPLSPWRSILFWRISEIDRRFWAWISNAHCKSIGNLDLAWLRWPLTLCALLMAANIFYFQPVAQWIALVANCAFGTLLCLYFGHLLLRRLQCSLLEFMVIVTLLFNLEGLLLTSRGLLSMGPLWTSGTAALAAGWVLYGAVSALISARLLRVSKSTHRLGLLVASWLGSAAPAIALMGLLLAFGRKAGLSGGRIDRLMRSVIAPRMESLGVALLVLGVAGILLHCYLSVVLSRAAHKEVAGSAA